ncbi:MAG TPA: BREX system P-loop protein BrxC, partial [Plasticicumulans sp.]|nr:BREX system P-loop protein BrxC [Plasticicumulans sp.]
MLNRDIYNKAPQENRLANNGVAEVSEDHSAAAQDILRYELETFVCDGQYGKGLETILDKFLVNLDAGTEQPGVWISGFYGSGKSHLAKMLRTLWTDYRFTDGATARSLARLPTGVFEHLKELSTQGKRYGTLHAAAGKLGAGAGDKVRLALLGIVFKSKGLPEQYNQAQLVLWMNREGLLPAIEAGLKAAGRSLADELPHMYVSGHLVKALLKARPDLAHTEADARKLLKEQFPQVTDVTSEQMTTAIEAALAVDGKFPLTLVVLDEVQQYIGNDGEKSFGVQELAETLCKHFKGKLLLVGTGQSALSGTPTLQKLMARFPIPVMLGDWDVENVTRQIILAKKPSAQPEVERVWRASLGEISRHLRGTKLEHVTDDEGVMTSDYPLLPVRRRFWERVLRTIDTTGTVSQLRSQLRVVHEAVLATADAPLGHVVSGDFLYDQIAANLVSTAQLPREVFENVQRFAAGDAHARLKG